MQRARLPRQAIAIGLSKARRAGIPVPLEGKEARPQLSRGVLSHSGRRFLDPSPKARTLKAEAYLTGRLDARAQERRAAARPQRAVTTMPAPVGEALAMLVRRGLAPRLARPDLPFSRTLPQKELDRIIVELRHYGFRLFLRGAILASGPFWPEDATRYLEPAGARRAGTKLVELGLAETLPGGELRLRQPARSFGSTLEWWVAQELAGRLRVDVAYGVRSGAPGVGGDLDVVAAVEGKLVYLELKSGPPKHLMQAEVGAFFTRLRALRPHLSILAIDTALRLSDKILPMLISSREAPLAPVRLRRDVWRVAPGLYAASAKGDLIENLCLAIADGLAVLAPEPP